MKEFKNNIKGKKVGLLGIGVSNLPVVEYLNSLGAKVVLYDKNNCCLGGGIIEELL